MNTSLGAIRRRLSVTALLVWALSSTAAAQVLYADVMAGIDPFAKVQNAVNALANGGQISAASFSGSLTITSGNLSIGQSGIRVEWGSATFTLGNNVINIQASNVEFVCQKGGTIFQSLTNTGNPWTDGSDPNSNRGLGDKGKAVPLGSGCFRVANLSTSPSPYPHGRT